MRGVRFEAMASFELGDVPDHLRCTATAKGTGQRCRQPRCVGVTVCEKHGATTSTALVKRQMAKLERELMSGGYGNNAVSTTHEAANPVTGLAWEIRTTAGNIEFLREKLTEISDDGLIWGTRSRTVKTTLADELADILGDIEEGYPRITRHEDSYKQTQEEAGIHVWAQLYLKERRHYVDLLKLAISSGLEHRRISIMEEHVLMVNNAVQNIIAKLGANPEDPAIRKLVKHEFAALMSQEAM